MPVTILNTGTFNGGASSLAGLAPASGAGLAVSAGIGVSDAGTPPAVNAAATASAQNAAGAGNPVVRGVPWYYNSGSAGSGSSFAVTKDPGVQPGDVILVFMAWNGTGTTPVITGFTAYPKTVNSLSIALFSRTADGTEGSTFTVAFASGFNVAAVCAAYQNANGLLDPVPANSGVITLATTVIPGASVTTARNNDVLIWFGAIRANGSGAPSPVIGVPAGLAPEGAQVSSSNAAGANMSVLLADGPGGTAGITGAMAGTSSLSVNTGGILLAVQSSATTAIVSASAGLASASAWAAVNVTGNAVTAPAGLAAAAASAQLPAVTAGLGTTIGAYILESQYPGGLTHAQAVSAWNASVGRVMAVERLYMGKNNMTGTVPANVLACLAAGRALMLSYKPSWHGGTLAQPLTGTSTSQATLDTQVNTFLAALVSAGFNGSNCTIDLWQEPWFSGITGGSNSTGADFISMFQHYAPVIRSYGSPAFTTGFCTSAASVWADNENSYYPGDAYVDFCLTDYYFPQYGTGGSPPLHPLGSGLSTDAAHPADNASPPKPFGFGELNSSTWTGAGYTKAQAQAYWGYILTYFQGRQAAGKPCAPLCVFNSNAGTPNTQDSAIVVADGVIDPYGGGSATEYRNALVAALVDGLA